MRPRLLLASLLVIVLAGCIARPVQYHAMSAETSVYAQDQEHAAQPERDILALPVAYLLLAVYDNEIVVVPGYMDPASSTFRPWKDVLLTRKHVPDWGELRRSRFEFVRGAVIEPAVIPPVAYTVTEGGEAPVVRVGYWDPLARSFLAWVGVGLTEREWDAYRQGNQQAQGWIRVRADEIASLSGVAVPRHHAQLAWAIETSGKSETPHSVQVAPDIEIRGPITTMRAD